MASEIVYNLPQADEAEKIVLGTMMLDSDSAIPAIEGLLDEDDFFSIQHRTIYHAIMHQFVSGGAADAVGVTHYLESTDKEEKAGEPLYITDLMMRVTTTATLQQYAQMVIFQSQKRKLIFAGKKLEELGYRAIDDTAKLQEDAMTLVNKAIFNESVSREIRPISDLEEEFLARIEAERGRDRPKEYLTTGFKTLDNRIFDMRGQLMVIAGSASMGKTLYLLNMAYKQARTGVKVGIISLEMTDDAIMNRLLIRHTKISAKERKYAQMDVIRKGMGELLILPIWLVSLGTSSLMGILREMRQMVLQYGIQCIYIDYMQLIGDISSPQRVIELEEISRQMLLFTKKYNVGIVIGSQFNREVMGTGDKRPKRKEYVDKGDTTVDEFGSSNLEMEIHWLKNRIYGEAGMVDKMAYQLSKQWVEDITYAPEEMR